MLEETLLIIHNPTKTCIWKRLMHRITSAYNGLFSKQTSSKSAEKSNANVIYNKKNYVSIHETLVPKKMCLIDNRRNQIRKNQRKRKKKRMALMMTQ